MGKDSGIHAASCPVRWEAGRKEREGGGRIRWWEGLGHTYMLSVRGVAEAVRERVG